jgi:uncharacterized cupin superfamily protein
MEDRKSKPSESEMVDDWGNTQEDEMFRVVNPRPPKVRLSRRLTPGIAAGFRQGDEMDHRQVSESQERSRRLVWPGMRK